MAGKAKAGMAHSASTLPDDTQGVQVKLCYPLTMRAIPEHLRDVSYIGAIQIDITFTFVTLEN